jgi:hypothetical protein
MRRIMRMPLIPCATAKYSLSCQAYISGGLARPLLSPPPGRGFSVAYLREAVIQIRVITWCGS